MSQSFLFVCLFLMCLPFLSAENPLSPEPAPTPEPPSFISWAWEIPDTLFSEYPITQYDSWSTAHTSMSAGIRYVHLRNWEGQDEFHMGGYANFRPVALYFGNSLMVLGMYGAIDAVRVEGQYFLDSENPQDVLTSDNLPFGLGFSMKWSLPQYNLQMEVEIGHYWTRVETVDKDVEFRIPQVPSVLFHGELMRRQKETGVSLYFGLSWLAERRYLSGIELNLSGSHPTGHQEVTREIHNIGPIPLPTISLPDRPTRTGTFIGLIYLKAIAIDVNDIVPAFQSKVRHSITLEPVGGITHLDYDNGYGLVAGVRLNLFELVGLSYFHSFKHRTDAADVDVFRLEIGMEIGGRLSGIKLGGS